jgi:hypothetical protein
MQIFQTVVGNTSPNIVITVQRNSTAIDVTGASVLLIITKEKTGTVTNTGQSCALTTPTTGIVTYTPLAGDFPTSGRYLGEIKITYSSGKVERINEEILFVARAATN